jgi:TetR/AcrR family transcriptional repressor of nem operon
LRGYEVRRTADLALNNDEAGSPRGRLESYLATLAEMFGAQSPRRGCFLSNAATDVADTDEGVAAVARDAFARIALALAGAVKDAHAAGEVSNDVDADSLGYLLLSVIRGISCIAKAGVPAATLADIAQTAAALLPRP